MKRQNGGCVWYDEDEDRMWGTWMMPDDEWLNEMIVVGVDATYEQN